ncbi:PepSY domain-containing protein [Dongia sedimenti]|uniref:PepSY domain-containing protein n=1 Tax=Dongia sedimenti TaxID=3064282 RepID=A0ABU0YGI7_9PROT|nr:PepSY domain-containing protein [Rhodospirillaceae bacterium R-7]
MKRLALTVLLASVAGIGSAAAAEICSVPQAEWQPKEALQQKLEAEGWKIKTIKIDEGCYEVYGTDAAGKRMETYFDPKSFEVKKQG